MLISQIKWSPSDTLFEIGGFSIYMYSLMFVVAFVLGYQLVKSFFTKEKCDQLIRIDMQGTVGSLNVSVACGVLLFEVVRQRNSSL